MTAGPVLDAVIVGGGPGGLTAGNAILAARPQTKIQIFERVPNMKPRGGIIALSEWCGTALKAIDESIVAKLSNSALEIGSFTTGDKLRNASMPREKSEGEAPNPKRLLSAQRWSYLQQTLHDTLPAGTVRLGYTFVSYEEKEHYVESTLKDGEENLLTLKSKILIGADGYNSQVRQLCVGDGPPDFHGNVIWRHFKTTREHAVKTDNEGKDSLSSGIYQDNGLSVFFAKSDATEIFSLIVPKEKLTGFCKVEIPVPGGGSMHSQDILSNTDEQKILLQLFKDWFSDLIEAIEQADPNKIYKRGEYVRTPHSMTEEWFGKRRVALSGDAVHPIPNVGVGANLACLEGYLIGSSIQDHEITKKALDAYRKTCLAPLRHVARVAFDYNVNGRKNNDLATLDKAVKELGAKFRIVKLGTTKLRWNQANRRASI